MMNVLRLKQSGRHFADDSFECIVSKQNFHIMALISLKFVHKGEYDNKSSVQAPSLHQAIISTTKLA